MLALLFLSMTSFAGNLSLDQALAEAQAQNPQLQIAKSESREAEAEKQMTFSTYLPHIYLYGNHSLSEKFEQMPIDLNGPAEFPVMLPYTVAALRAEWELFNGFRGYQTHQAAGERNQAATLNLQRIRFETNENTRLKYYRAKAAMILQEVAAQNIKTLDEHRADIENYVRSGSTTKFDLLRIEVQLSEARPDLLSAEDQVRIARMELAQLLGKTDDQRDLNDELPEPPEVGVRNLQMKLDERDDYQAQVAAEAAARHDAKASSATWMPQVGVYGETQQYNFADHSLSDNYKDAYFVGLTFNWSLFDGGAGYAKQKMMAEKSYQAQMKTKTMSDQAAVDFENWKRQYLYSKALYQARKVAIDKAKESVRLARAGVRAGSRTNTELLDAELDLFRSRAGAVKAQVEALEALSRLELTVGHTLAKQ